MKGRRRKPHALIYGGRYDRMMDAFGGKGFFVQGPKDPKGALDEAMNFRGPALVNVVISQGFASIPRSVIRTERGEATKAKPPLDCQIRTRVPIAARARSRARPAYPE